jgi:uncharacterized membrane protein
LILTFPFFGIAAGYWIWKGKYGWRLIIIILSILMSGSVLFMSLFISPKLKALKEQKHMETQH